MQREQQLIAKKMQLSLLFLLSVSILIFLSPVRYLRVFKTSLITQPSTHATVPHTEWTALCVVYKCSQEIAVEVAPDNNNYNTGVCHVIRITRMVGVVIRWNCFLKL